jgi:hypothetical protein
MLQTGKTVVIFSGRFQPFHRGHAAMYAALQERFPNADVWVATSGKVGPDSPFNFQQRKALAELMGIPGNRITEVKNPYIAVEILANYNGQTDMVIFALSEKDADRLKFGLKKDGTPTYLQKYESNMLMKPFDTTSGHAYVTVMPVVSFKIADNLITSASDIRRMLTDRKLTAMILEDLYGNNAEQADSIIANYF